MSGCCNCCGLTSLVGVVFFGITATMVKRENAVFLSHKAGIDLHTVTQDQIDDKFMAMVTTSIVSHTYFYEQMHLLRACLLRNTLLTLLFLV